MRKKFFDKGLMVEGLTQLRLPGFIFLAISVLGSAIPAIFTCIDYYSYKSKNGTDISYLQSLRIIGIQRVSPILLPVIYIAPFVLCLVLFKFLNNRSGSDYYHSLSFTRVNMFLSFSAAIILWIALMVVSAVFIAYFIYAIAGMIIDAVYIPYLILTFLSGAFLVTSCMLLAMSITGTAMTNAVLFGLILFLPRFILAIFMSNLFSCLPIISANSGGLANVSNNIPVNLIYRYLISHSYSSTSLYTSIPAIVYTFVLAAIYISAACLLFHFRKSEAAGSSAPNKALQHVYRCAVTLPVALFIPYIILDGIATGHSSATISTIVTLAVISLFIYFLFELLTTKSFRKMIKSAPVFLVVVAVCFIYGAVISATRSSILNFTPSGSEIGSITILPSNSSYNGQARTYNELKLKNVQFSDSLIKNDVSIILANDVRILKSSFGYASNNSSYRVGIRLKSGRYAERVLFAYGKMATEFSEVLNTNSQYTENSTMLPDKNSIRLMSVGDITDNASIRELWNSYKNEYNALSDNDKQSMSISIYDSGKELTSITADGSIDMEKYENRYKINENTPKTAALYIKLLNLQNKAKAKSFISTFNKINPYDFYCYIKLYGGLDISKSTTLVQMINGNANDTKKNVTKCCKTLLKQIDGDIDITKPFVFVTIDSENKSFRYYQPVSSGTIKEIKSIGQ